MGPKLELTEEIATRFRESLVCSCSLASRELYHSNFLAWLLSTHGFGLLERLLNHRIPADAKVHREKHHFDLMVETHEGRIVIENKVKSLPSDEQLQRYSKKLKNGDRLVLLTLVKPSVNLQQQMPGVTVITYDQLRNELGSVPAKSAYWQSALEDYSFLVDVLLAIRDEATRIDWNTPLLLKKDIADRLRSIRLLDIAEKLRFESALNLMWPHIARMPQRSPILRLLGFTRGQAILDLKWPLGRDQFLGVQVQGGQYRRFIEVRNAECVAETLAASDFWVFGPEPRDRSSNKFGAGFKYRYCKLTTQTIQQICDMLQQDAEAIAASWDEITDIVSRVPTASLTST